MNSYLWLCNATKHEVKNLQNYSRLKTFNRKFQFFSLERNVSRKSLWGISNGAWCGEKSGAWYWLFWCDKCINSKIDDNNLIGLQIMRMLCICILKVKKDDAGLEFFWPFLPLPISNPSIKNETKKLAGKCPDFPNKNIHVT